MVPSTTARPQWHAAFRPLRPWNDVTNCLYPSSHPVGHTTLILIATKTLLTSVLDGSARRRPRRKNTVRR